MPTWFEQNAVNLIGHALTIIGIVGAAVMVVWQLGRQHRSSLLLQRENARNKLKLQLHEQLVLKVRKLSDANNAPPNMPRPLIPNFISSDEHAQLKKLVAHYKKAMDEIGCYIHDLTIESQNNLLSDLFERRVPQRQPIDPRHKVINVDPEKAEELLHYFENETPWGKAKRATEADVRAMLERP